MLPRPTSQQTSTSTRFKAALALSNFEQIIPACIRDSMAQRIRLTDWSRTGCYMCKRRHKKCKAPKPTFERIVLLHCDKDNIKLS